VDTSEIRYRIADFLKQHPPFSAIGDADLVALAALGRVRFFPSDEFLTWQGEPHKTHVLVIQQGTVSLWDEQGGHAELRDVRGPGDWIGAEQFHGAPSCLYTARADTDVVTYGFPVHDLDSLLEKYPYAARFVAAMGSVDSSFSRGDAGSDVLAAYLPQFAGPLTHCRRQTTVREAARQLLHSGAEALAVVDDGPGLLGVVTARVLLRWITEGAGDPEQPVSEAGVLFTPTAGPSATVADGAWELISHEALALTEDGTPKSRLLTVMTPRDLLPALGDQPAAILDDISRAPDLPRLRALNQRARAFVLKYLTSPASVEWLQRFTARVDDAMLDRVFQVVHPDVGSGSWCVWGAWARRESLPPRMPQLLWMQDSGVPGVAASTAYERLTDAFAQCGYLPAPEASHDPAFYLAPVTEWRDRYLGWIRNPVLAGMQRSRALFDLRYVRGLLEPTLLIQREVREAIDRDIVHILAHDCLADLPPLSFYQGAVVEHTGEVSDVFRLQGNVLQPLVDLGRVFGVAARSPLDASTLARLAAARGLVPEHERIFRDASEALRIVLWQQGRVGITQWTVGAELPASVLSRNDRHLLKSTFPVIQRLIEFTADPAWLDAWDAAGDRNL
jgi:CBS domain-containing protein